MQKILLVIKNEIYMVVSRRSYWLTLLLIPAVSFVVLMVIGNARQEEQPSPVTEFFSTETQASLDGLVDESGIVHSIPDAYQDVLRTYPDEPTARTALEAGEISSYYLIPADYLESGQVIVYRTDFNPLGGISQSDSVDQTITQNLLASQPDLERRFMSPMDLQVTYLQEQQPRHESDSMANFYLPYVVAFLFYFIIFSSASLMLNSITAEKQNRVVEVLMTSMTPAQMLTGKIIALGVLGLAQTLVWSTAGLIFLNLSRQMFDLSAAFQLPPSILAWGVLYFLLGYAVNASLMAGVGALVPNLRESSQATLVVILPMLVPLMMIGVLTESPNGAFSVGMSLFPLTAPVAMMARMAATDVPLWQVGLSVVLLAATAVLTVRAVAGMFRAQTLLSGQAFNLKLFFLSLAGRA
ncbi:MAG: ABC transporter permease [Chloroflexi bacterium]|nr:ABC transporter permease [Anaerolineaceae bacterium]NMB89134.1 ABC transporter permease [Chloroflexota bacterium]